MMIIRDDGIFRVPGDVNHLFTGKRQNIGFRTWKIDRSNIVMPNLPQKFQAIPDEANKMANDF